VQSVGSPASEFEFQPSIEREDRAMIAPLRQPEQPRSELERRLSHARRAVARSLLPQTPARPAVRRVPAWKAWTLVGWMAIVAACYVTRMLGWWG
jgi:hypothetical protein